jgi:hypothetical protein
MGSKDGEGGERRGGSKRVKRREWGKKRRYKSERRFILSFTRKEQGQARIDLSDRKKEAALLVAIGNRY